MKDKEKIVKDSGEMFNKYMHLISSSELEQTYRLKSDTGEGIMRRYNVSRGIYYIYSEIEKYYPLYQEQRQLVRHIEIMYMVEGHADFEMEGKRWASANTGDVCIFSSNVATKNCIVGPKGMRCISIVVCIDDAAEELNRLLGTDAFDKDKIYEGVLSADNCICFAATDMLKVIFNQLMQLPDTYGDHYRKLLTYQTIIATMDVKGRKATDQQYFSKDTENKVHEARKILGTDISINISIEELSARVKLNRTTLQKVFKQMYGMTIFEYRTQIRIQEAKNLILEGCHTITEIAGFVGYCNASKFSASFKKITGVSPSEFGRY
jgi:AraC-like DNA-binding protein